MLSIAAHTNSPIFDFAELCFSEVSVPFEMPNGAKYTRRLRLGMPKIPPDYLKTVFYLYRNAEDAMSGIDKGGTGFFVSIPSAVPGREFRYLVTNWHVAISSGYSVPCLVKIDGSPEPIDIDCADWHFMPEYDIAVLPVSVSSDKYSVAVVPISAFTTQDMKSGAGIGPGDDIFMIGLFVDNHGAPHYSPSVRFGHISMDPAPMSQGTGRLADSYCIDVHSRSGYSGSPVFVYRTPGYDLGERLGEGDDMKILLAGTNHLSLLGIHWGQFPEMWEVTSSGSLRSKNEANEPLLTDGKFIKGLSGMTCVLPAWSILEVLNMPKLKEIRDKANEELLRKYGSESPVPESLGKVGSGDNLLKTMLATPPQKD